MMVLINEVVMYSTLEVQNEITLNPPYLNHNTTHDTCTAYGTRSKYRYNEIYHMRNYSTRVFRTVTCVASASVSSRPTDHRWSAHQTRQHPITEIQNIDHIHCLELDVKPREKSWLIDYVYSPHANMARHVIKRQYSRRKAAAQPWIHAASQHAFWIRTTTPPLWLNSKQSICDS